VCVGLCVCACVCPRVFAVHLCGRIFSRDATAAAAALAPGLERNKRRSGADAFHKHLHKGHSVRQTHSGNDFAVFALAFTLLVHGQ